MAVTSLQTFPDGMAAAPGLALESEPGTGFFKKAGGKIGFSAGGVEVGVLDAGGLVGAVRLAEVMITQTSGNGTYTGSIAVPAGARVIDIGVTALALWDGTSASLEVGDSDANGYFTATNLVATDLLVGETNNIEHPGGKAGAYLASEQRVLYTATAQTITFIVTQVGTGTLGRTRGYVAYAAVTAVDAVKA